MLTACRSVLAWSASVQIKRLEADLGCLLFQRSGKAVQLSNRGSAMLMEQPGTGHGLLTYAVMKAMTTTAVEQISFPGVADEIVQIARVEAERIGVSQTPVFLGSVQGGLVFPRLIFGANYGAAFPSTVVEQMLGPFEQLLDNGFPQSIVDQWVARFSDGLNALQLRAVNEFGVLAGRSLMTVAPTSSGKTMVGACCHSVGRRRKEGCLPPPISRHC